MALPQDTHAPLIIISRVALNVTPTNDDFPTDRVGYILMISRIALNVTPADDDFPLMESDTF